MRVPEALRERSFRLLFFAQATSLLGDGMVSVALAFAVLDLTGARVDFKKGGVAAVRVRPGRGELLALLRPRELEALAPS